MLSLKKSFKSVPNASKISTSVAIDGEVRSLSSLEIKEEKQEELEERISYLEEETTSNYDHILELSKEEVEGD